jgi:TetR/AcrR family transcriptional repressor of nem operon
MTDTMIDSTTRELAPKADEILDVTQALVQQHGYHGFSFRDVAKAVGIKSASVHYHFPTKELLGAALTRRYTDRVLAHLGDPEDRNADPDVLIGSFIGVFRNVLEDDGLMCLCGMLGAETRTLPQRVAMESRRFFRKTGAWLAAVLKRRDAGLSDEQAEATALRTIATLEGSMLVSRALDDLQAFDRIASNLDL